jgi:hypothetical protein
VHFVEESHRLVPRGEFLNRRHPTLSRDCARHVTVDEGVSQGMHQL